MHYKTRNSGRRRSRIAAAILAGMPIYRTDGGEGPGGGASPTPTPTATKQAEKLTLSDEDRKAIIDAERAKWQAEADAKAKKAEDERQAEEAKKRGEFEKVAESEKAKREAAEARVAELERSQALSAHLAEKHPDYVASAKYIAPLIPADVEGDELAKAVEKAAADFVKDNPRQAKGSAGAPPGQPRTGNRALGANAAPQNNQRPARRFSTLTSRG